MVEVGKRPEFDKARANKDGTLDERLLQELWYPQRELEELDQKFPRLLGVSNNGISCLCLASSISACYSIFGR